MEVFDLKNAIPFHTLFLLRSSIAKYFNEYIFLIESFEKYINEVRYLQTNKTNVNELKTLAEGPKH